VKENDACNFFEWKPTRIRHPFRTWECCLPTRYNISIK
jgi:hypothetical protein